MTIIKSVPTIAFAVNWMVPLIQSLAKSKFPPQLYRDGRDPLNVDQDLILGLVDAPTKKPKRITDIYDKRERELIDAIQVELGDQWWVAKMRYDPIDELPFTLVRIIPDRTTLIFDQEDDKIILPGVSKRSRANVRFVFHAYQFEKPEFVSAFKLMVL